MEPVDQRKVRFGSKPEKLKASTCFPLCSRKQTSVSAAAMTDPDPNPFADCDVVVCYGGAKLADKHHHHAVSKRHSVVSGERKNNGSSSSWSNPLSGSISGSE